LRISDWIELMSLFAKNNKLFSLTTLQELFFRKLLIYFIRDVASACNCHSLKRFVFYVLQFSQAGCHLSSLHDLSLRLLNLHLAISWISQILRMSLLRWFDSRLDNGCWLMYIWSLNGPVWDPPASSELDRWFKSTELGGDSRKLRIAVEQFWRSMDRGLIRINLASCAFWISLAQRIRYLSKASGACEIRS